MISITLMGVVMAAVTSSYIFITKSSISMGNYASMNEQSRMGLEIFSRDIRMTTDVTYFDADELDLTVSFAEGESEPVEYDYDSGAQTLTRKADDYTKTILKDVTDMQFSFYNLAGQPTTKLIEIKKIHFDATMERQVLGLKNTNQVISADYMMRNRKVAN